MTVDDDFEMLRRELLRDFPGDERSVEALTRPLTRAQKDRIVQRVLVSRGAAPARRSRARSWTYLAVAGGLIAFALGAPVGDRIAVSNAEAAELTALAADYRDRSMYERAEPLLRRALELRERELGPQHTLVAASLTELADLYQRQRLETKAEPLLRRAFEIQPTAVF